MIIATELKRRFGEDAAIAYIDIESDEAKSDRQQLLEEIDTKGYLYPVTVIDGIPAYDGAVSYPAILRAVNDRLQQLAEA
jgi:disulfide oxidoreductase YuzD